MSTLRNRLSEPQFVSILQGLVFLFFAVGIAVVAERVNEGADRIYASTGVVFWPRDPATRFNWNFMYGNPWLALALGCGFGMFLGLALRARRERKKSVWIRDAVRAAKGHRVSTTSREVLGLGALVVVQLVPVFVLSMYFQISGAVFGNAVVAFMGFTHYSQIRAFRLDVYEILRADTLSDDEAHNVARWQLDERKALGRMYRFAALCFVVCVVGTVFFALRTDRILLDAEQTIVRKQIER